MGNAHPNVAPTSCFRPVIAPSSLLPPTSTCGSARLPDPRPGRAGRGTRATPPNRCAWPTGWSSRRRSSGPPGQRSAGEWVDRLTAAAVPAALVNDLGDAFRLAEELGLSLIEFAEAADGSSVPLVRSPIGLSGSRTPPPTAPPRLDEHGAEIRHEGVDRGPDEIGRTPWGSSCQRPLAVRGQR